MAKNYLRREPGFYKRLFLLALPLILQNLITTSLGFVDTFMVGLLGQSELSAVTAANSPIFLIQVIVFGFISGLTVLTSQYWGKGDVEAINRCMGVALYIGVAVAAIMALVLFCFPTFVMGLVTNNTLLIEMGAAISAYRGHQLYLQRRQCGLCGHAAQHRESCSGHGGLCRLHAAEHLFELHSDLW